MEKQKEISIKDQFIKILPYESDIFQIVTKNHDIYLNGYLDDNRVLILFNGLTLDEVNVFYLDKYENLIKYSNKNELIFYTKYQGELQNILDKKLNTKRKPTPNELDRIAKLFYGRTCEYVQSDFYKIIKNGNEVIFSN